MHTRGRLGSKVRATMYVGTTHAHAGQTFAYRSGFLAVSEPPMHTRGRHAVHSFVDGIQGTTHAHAGQTLRLW